MCQRLTNIKSSKKPQGFTLIEVVVSFFLLSIALMALLKLDETSIEETRTLLWQAVALTELDNGLSLVALKDANAWSNWQMHISDVLPLARINYVPPDNLEITWHLPKMQTTSSVKYQGDTQLTSKCTSVTCSSAIYRAK